MCGISGTFSSPKAPHHDHDFLRRRIQAMTDALHHRGPDSGDIWIDEERGIALGHRRLAIVDLSEAGHQPMHSSCGRYVMTYNGEVYNTDELRQDLVQKGRSFRGHSDTEVILEGCAVWGIEQTISRLIGMFAIGVWDKEKRELTLIRDRLGIKPLYWAQHGSTIYFASELKSFRAAPDFQTSLNHEAVSAFLSYNYVPAPLSIYQTVFKLKPGTCLTFTSEGNQRENIYWSLDDAIRQARYTPFTGSDQDAIEALDELLGDAVRRRMIADVPLGAFLSGGVDSSLIVALMQKHASRPVKTFTIGFEDQAYNEATHAKKIAAHLGTEHTELYVSAQDAMDVIPQLPAMFDEPFADVSQIPTFLVSRMTRQHVTVSLSGDGGDELFAGYHRYRQAGILQNIPLHLRQVLAFCIYKTPGLKHLKTSDKLYKLADLIGHSRDNFYPVMLTHWGPTHKSHGVKAIWDQAQTIADALMDQMQYTDLLTYLPDDILTKVDRTSMAVALEARVPLLDHRIVAFSWSLPQRMKSRKGQQKWILQELLKKYVPQTLTDRPKMGFAVPVGQWLRGSLRDWAGDLLSEQNLKKHDLVDIPLVRLRWQEHLSGTRNWQYLLWDILMLQSWCEEWG